MSSFTHSCYTSASMLEFSLEMRDTAKTEISVRHKRAAPKPRANFNRI